MPENKSYDSREILIAVLRGRELWSDCCVSGSPGEGFVCHGFDSARHLRLYTLSGCMIVVVDCCEARTEA